MSNLSSSPKPQSSHQYPARKGILLVISAPSGTGKSTLLHKLRKRHPNISFSISCTTRAPRQGEQDGKDYFFITKNEFLARREQAYFAEWAEVHGNFYGTPLDQVRRMYAQGQDILFDLDVQGALQLKQTLPLATFVFLFPPSLEELKNRLLARGTETEQTLRKRLQGAAGEIAQAHHFDYHIINDDLESAFYLLNAVYLAQTAKKELLPDIAATLLAAQQDNK